MLVMRAMLVFGICLLSLVISGIATVPSDAPAIGLGQEVVGFAPGAYYKIDISTTGTLSVILEEVPADMLTRIAIINEAGSWLASDDTASPGQKITVEAQVDAPGWYYIGVLDLEGKNHEAPYVFRVVM